MFDMPAAHRYFRLLRERFTRQQAFLNELDAAAGDGDHGYTVARAFRAAAEAVSGSFSDLGSLFDTAALALAESGGGAVGPLLAGLFAEGGLIFAQKSSASLPEIGQWLTGGLEAIQAIGGAQVGDKTLVDALAPAAAVFAATEAGAADDLLHAAARAARAGAENTRQMQAAFGRARFTGARSIGHPDPGAFSIALLVSTLKDALDGQDAAPFAPAEEPPSPPPGKLINNPEKLVAEDNLGLALANPQLVRLTPTGILVRAVPKASGKVGLAIGHGGGHTPSMGGLVGPGLLDADVYGPIFTCASGVRIAQAIEQAQRGAGVVLLVSNHSGDVLNARLALRRAAQIGIPVSAVYLGDDVATAPRAQIHERRGLGGLLFALKIGGAAAEAGLLLDEVSRLMFTTSLRTASLAVALKPPTHPVSGIPLFDLPPGEIEIGTGVHGEVGVYRGPHKSADEIVDLLVDRLLDDLRVFVENQYLVFVNGSGGTSKMELHIVYQRVHHQLLKRGFTPVGAVVDSLFTTQEMAGFSLSFCAATPEMLSWWDLPARGPSFYWPHF
jgi:phosphoenolpyruvate---glycerone phosphotransferase subunit DhaK